MTLDAELRTLAAALREEIPAMVEHGLEQMRRELPEFFVRDDDPDFVDVYRQSFRAQLRFIYDGLESGRDVEGVEAPPLALEEARMAAARGIELATILQGYRVTHRLILDAALERVRDPAALRVTSRWLFTYMDWMTRRVSEAYRRERDLLVRDRERRTRQLVRDVLDDVPIDAAQIAYSLEQSHLGVVAWGEAPERALADAAEAAGLALLTVSGTDGTAWGWLGGTRADVVPAGGEHGPAGPSADGVHVPADAKLEPPPGTQLAVGTPGEGVEGFRSSHRQALSTYRIARGTTQPVTTFADVALLALTLQDPTLAREFVRCELGPLAADDARSQLLRETLRAYFDAGQNAAAAAAALGVHERTVTYRLRSIEERLGRPLRTRRDELGVALRLAPVVLGLS